MTDAPADAPTVVYSITVADLDLAASALPAVEAQDTPAQAALRRVVKWAKLAQFQLCVVRDNHKLDAQILDTLGIPDMAEESAEFNAETAAQAKMAATTQGPST